MRRLAVLARSIEVRTALVLLLAVLFVHVGESTLYRWSATAAADEAFATELARQLSLAREAVLRRPTGERADEARALSAPHFEIGWSMEAPGGKTGVTALRPLRERLLALDPSLGPGLLLWMQKPDESLHHEDMYGVVALRDGSFLTFRSDHAPRLRGLGLWSSLSSAMAILVMIAALFLMHRIAGPLRELTRATGRIGRGETVPVPELGPDETRGIARALNAMQARIQRLIGERTQALAAVSHDLRTPIARLRLRLDTVADEKQRVAMVSDLDEMQSMIDLTLQYLRGDADPEKRQLVDVRSLLLSVADAFTDTGKDVACGRLDRGLALLRPVAFRRALDNLVDNALRYGVRARLSLEIRETTLVLLVDDDGPGLSADEARRAFEPFTRLDASRNRGTGGAGLGLTITRRAIEAEGGSIALTTRREGGLRVEIALPRATPGDPIST